MKYQDIHSTDSALWKQYQSLMESGSYDEAAVVLKNAQLDNKRIDAALFNNITTELTRLQNQGKDSTWSKNVMAVATEPPTDMSAGECYCKVTHRMLPMYKVVVHGFDDAPTVQMTKGGKRKVLENRIWIGHTIKSRDGVYYAPGTFRVTIDAALVYLKYGIPNTGKVLIYINGEKKYEKQETLSDWSIDEDKNEYACSIGGYAITAPYDPFVMFDSTRYEAGDYDFDSDVDINATYEQTDEVINITVNITTS